MSIFKPKDVYPCVVSDEDWFAINIESLFGDLCRGNIFLYDEELKASMNLADDASAQSSQRSVSVSDMKAVEGEAEEARIEHPNPMSDIQTANETSTRVAHGAMTMDGATDAQSNDTLKRGANAVQEIGERDDEVKAATINEHPNKKTVEEMSKRARTSDEGCQNQHTHEDLLELINSQSSSTSEGNIQHRVSDRKLAYEAALDWEGVRWHKLDLVSVAGRHNVEETEL